MSRPYSGQKGQSSSSETFPGASSTVQGENSTADLNEKRATTGSTRSRKKLYIILGSVLAVLVIIGAVLGGVLASRNNNNNKTNNEKLGQGSAANAADVASGVASSATSTAASSSSSATAQASVSPLPLYDWTKSSLAGALAEEAAGATNVQAPMIGVALGSWLILEQWMVQPWFNASANNNASVIDEWNLMLALGDNALSTMQQHWSTFFTESDIETAHQAGINQLRIPLGFWAFIDTIPGEPYLAKAGQLDYLEQAMGWAYKRNMYVVIDLHGLPGSQNGEITSGVFSTNPHFFQDDYMERTDATVTAALAWIEASPYRSVVSALGLVNEPRPYTQAQINMLQAYYQRSYEKTMALSNPVPLQFHHGFVDQILKGTSYLDYWRSFVKDKDPRYISMETHPYVGTFPLQTDTSNMLQQVCSNAASFAAYPVPVAITEWSLRTGVKDASFEKQFYTQQLTAWANTGGGVFWNLKAINGGPADNNGDNSQWSFQTLLNNGIIPLPSSGQSSLDYLKSLGNPCGTPSMPSWASSSNSTSSRKTRHRARQF